MFTGQRQSPSPPSPAPGLARPAAPFLPWRRGNAKWWKKPEPLFRKVKRGAVLACLLSHAYSIRPGPGPYGKEEGDSSPLFNIPLQAWLYLSCFPSVPRRREGDGLKFLYICILSTSSTEQATLFPPPALPGSGSPGWGAAPGGSAALPKVVPPCPGCWALASTGVFGRGWTRHTSLLPALTTSPLLCQCCISKGKNSAQLWPS